MYALKGLQSQPGRKDLASLSLLESKITLKLDASKIAPIDHYNCCKDVKMTGM